MVNVLVIAPHPDDEILGCGGTMAKYSKIGHNVVCCIVTKGYSPDFDEELIKKGRAEDVKAAKMIGVHETIFLNHPASNLESVRSIDLIADITEVIAETDPDEVYIPHYGDIHKDHKAVADAAMVCLRPKSPNCPSRVYAYETLSETGWDYPTGHNAFLPTVYHDITDTLYLKLEAMNTFKSQLLEYPSPRSIESLAALAAYRGSAVHLDAAEAFQLIREIKR
jgi:LmbE family N-acetylglucosaminyl deacetylase